jgi:sec-independent protein translocase protein TatC
MEAFPLRAVAHDERLTVTEHLSELRARLLLSVAVLAVLFAGCLWQSRPLLRVLNAPLAQLETSSAPQGSGIELPQALARSADAFTRLVELSASCADYVKEAVRARRSMCCAQDQSACG